MGPFIESPPLTTPTAAVQVSAPVGAPAKPDLGARVPALAKPFVPPSTWATRCFPDVKRIYPDLQKVVYPPLETTDADDSHKGGRTGKRGKSRAGKPRDNKGNGPVVEVREINAEEVEEEEEGWEKVKRKERKARPSKNAGGNRNGGGEWKKRSGGKKPASEKARATKTS